MAAIRPADLRNNFYFSPVWGTIAKIGSFPRFSWSRISLVPFISILIPLSDGLNPRWPPCGPRMEEITFISLPFGEQQQNRVFSQVFGVSDFIVPFVSLFHLSSSTDKHYLQLEKATFEIAYRLHLMCHSIEGWHRLLFSASQYRTGAVFVTKLSNTIKVL